MWLLSLLGACSSPPECTGPTDILAQVSGDALTCADAEIVPRYVVRLSARELNAGDRQLALTAVAAAFEGDPTGTRSWLASVQAAGAALEGISGLEAAERRGAALWHAARGEGPITPDREDLWNLQRRMMSIWTTHDAEGLALSEVDIEGWLRYVSLCREAQGGAPLRLSIADRTIVYKAIASVFHAGERADRVALLAVGPFWPQVKSAWAAASYEQQQAWIAQAPLPPPMTATSLGYSEAIVSGDVRRHAAVLHERLGPLELGWGEGSLAAPPPVGPAGVQLAP